MATATAPGSALREQRSPTSRSRDTVIARVLFRRTSTCASPLAPISSRTGSCARPPRSRGLLRPYRHFSGIAPRHYVPWRSGASGSHGLATRTVVLAHGDDLRHRLTVCLVARVVVSSLGYRGDVFAYVRIASELARRGHHVTYVVPEEFHRGLDGLGFRCASPGFDIGPTVLDQHAQLVRHAGGLLMMRHLFVNLLAPHLQELFDAVDAEVSRADVVISSQLASAVTAASCAVRGVPMILGDVFPMHVPSASTPPQGFPNLGPRANRVAWAGGRRLMPRAQPGGTAIRKFRRELGLEPDGWSMLDTGATLTLGLASAHYVEEQPDWPSNYHLVGFSTWSGPPDQPLPEEVAAFLEAGAPPIVITQGTAAASARTDFFVRAADAVASAGGRSILLTSTERNAAEVRSQVRGDETAVWPFVPLEPLLERAGGAVHAGGFGTTALTVSAGVPSAIAPCFNDSYWQAKRHEALGIGMRIRRRSLRVAVERLVNDAELGHRARALAQRVAQEDGTRTACDHIEDLLAA